MPIILEPKAEPIPGYRLVERLGSGGFGEVWKAEAPGGLQKAIKFVFGQSPGKTELGESKAERELKGLSRVRDIRHPFIVSMERFEFVEGRLVIVMELADRDLYNRFRDCRDQKLAGIPREELIKYLVEASEALDLMNFEHEVQHLDIKPQNLFLIQNHVKVADFGLAKDLEGFSANVTSGMTPMYAAPEIFNGKVSRNTDQYSLAIVYQELLTGKLPFCGPSPVQFMNQHLTKEPDLRALPGCDQPILRRALDKDPNARFSSCREFIDELLHAEKSPTMAGFSRGKEERSPAQNTPSKKPISEEETVIGIDLGTTNSVLAILCGREAKVIADSEGNRLTPSVVAFNDKGDRLVGTPAKRQATTNPTRTIASVKRLMGRTRQEVADEEPRLPYKLAGDPESPVSIAIGDKVCTPQEVSAMVLRKVRQSAEEYLGHPVKRAVVTVPAYFSDSQRQATKEAGAIAGLEVVRILNEPTAASLAYGLEKGKNQRIAVFDLGGGTFDITILRIRDGIFDVLSTNGDTRLGGNDFDYRLVQLMINDFKNQTGIDAGANSGSLQRLQEAAENAKKELSSQMETTVHLPFLAADSEGAKHLSMTITRSEFENACADLFDRLRPPCLQAIEDARLKLEEIEEVVLVGGSSRIPRVQEIAREIFGKEPHKGVNPDEAIAIGAAIKAGILAGKFEDILLLDVTPLSLGIETRGGLVNRIIERNTTIPTIRKKIFTTAENGQNEVGIHIVQGEREFATDNRSLGVFWLDGIRPAPVGVPQIEVTFNIDANGILEVTARDLTSEQHRSLRVASSQGLSQTELERLKKEAEDHAAADEKRRQWLEAHNAAVAALAGVDRIMRDLASKITESQRKAIEKAIQNVKEAITKEDETRVPLMIWTLQQLLQATESEAKRSEKSPAAAPA